MFYSLNPAQISSIRRGIFPQQKANNSFIKKIVLKKDTINTSKIEVTIAIDKNEFNKVFNNEKLRKYIKLKIFEIKSDGMYTQLLAVNQPNNLNLLDNIQTIISQNNTGQIDFSIVSDFKNLDINSSDYLHTLKFIASKDIPYYSLGIICFLDKDEYISEEKINEASFDSRVTFDTLSLYRILTNDSASTENISKIQDLRFIDTVFQQNKEFNDLFTFINSRSSYEKLLNSNKNNFINPNADQETINAFTKSSLVDKNQNIFSDIYITKNFSDMASFVFTINYKKAIKNNTAYNNFLTNQAYVDYFNFDFSAEYIKNCRIKSIKVLRRNIDINNRPILNTTVELCVGKQLSDKLSNVLDEENSISLLSEIQLKNNQSKFYRTFCAVDKYAKKQSGILQYGVELTISDGIYNTLYEHLLKMRLDNANLNVYLNETNKISGNNPSYLKTGGFTSSFISSFGTSQFANYAASSIRSFVFALFMINYLNFNNQQINMDLVRIIERTLFTLLDPNLATQETINYFISSFNKVQQFIEKTIKDNKNNYFTIANWFDDKKQCLNTQEFFPKTDKKSKNTKIGYKFINATENLPVKVKTGFSAITKNDYINRCLLEKQEISDNLNIEDSSYINTVKNSFISPLDVYTKNLTFSNNGKIYSSIIKTKEFLDLEADIKNTYSDDAPLHNSLIKDLRQEPDNANTQIKQLKNNKISKVVELINEKLDADNLKFFSSIVTKYYNGQNKKYILEKTSVHKNYNLLNFVINDIDPRSNLPYQLYFYGKNAHKLFNRTKLVNSELDQPNVKTENGINNLPDEEKTLYLAKNIPLMSKMNILFNTIHRVEFLTYDSNMKEVWQLLTQVELERLSENEMHVCRLVNFSSENIGISGIETVKLPIFDRYFLLIG